MFTGRQRSVLELLPHVVQLRLPAFLGAFQAAAYVVFILPWASAARPVAAAAVGAVR